MDEAIRFLLTLQDYDMRLCKLIQNRSHIPQNITALDGDIEMSSQKIIQEKNAIQNVKLETQKLEKDFKSSEEMIVAGKYKLAFTKSHREYEILAKTIADEERKVAQLEEVLLKRMLENDSRQLEFASLQQTVNSEIQRIQNEKERQQQLSAHLEENIAELNHKIAVIRGIIQENHGRWLRHYDETKKAIRKMPCIVFVKNDQYCGGCNLRLSGNIAAPDPDFPFIICESCARLILIDSPTVEVAVEANGEDNVDAN
jgi:predicted  nucleic acid-binding Zn-ribbon protein